MRAGQVTDKSARSFCPSAFAHLCSVESVGFKVLPVSKRDNAGASISIRCGGCHAHCPAWAWRAKPAFQCRHFVISCLNYLRQKARRVMDRRKPCKRYNDPGHAHALTFSCFKRQSFLSKDGSRKWLIEAIDRARFKHRFHIWAYVIMRT